jgi:hypothetical protein
VSGEADVGYLERGQHPVLAEESTDGSVPISHSSEDTEEPLFDVAMTRRLWRIPR